MKKEDTKAIGRILLEQNAISQAALDKALSQHVPGMVPLASRLTEQGLISEHAALKALSKQRGVPGIDLNQVCIKLADLEVVPRDVALRHKLLPVLEREDRIFCAMANPEDRKALEELEFVTGKRIFAYIALEVALMRVIAEAYDRKDADEAFYVGPSCPAEVLERAGIAARPASPPEPPKPPVAPIRPAPAPAAAPQPPPAPPPAARPKPPPPPPARPKAPAPAPAPMFPPSPSPAKAAPARAVAPERAKQEPVRSPQERRFRPSSAGFAIPDQQVIVDEQMQKHVDQEVNEADFGDVARHLSVVQGMPKSEPPQKPGSKKILIVDDEADIRKMLRRVFEEKGYHVVEADRGRLALQMVKTENPDLIVLDAMLPEIHGFDIARRIRGSTRYGHTPIIMVSAVYRGWRIAEDVKQSYNVDAYIEKPFRVADVLAAVEEGLLKKQERVDPDRISSEAERLLNEGVAAYKAGDLDKATELLEAGTKVDPLAYRLRFHLGLLYGKRGQVYDAIQELERALEIQGKHFASVKNLAILYQQAGFRNRAVEAWERALHLAPDEDTKKTVREHLLTLI